MHPSIDCQHIQGALNLLYLITLTYLCIIINLFPTGNVISLRVMCSAFRKDIGLINLPSNNYIVLFILCFYYHILRFVLFKQLYLIWYIFASDRNVEIIITMFV